MVPLKKVKMVAIGSRRRRYAVRSATPQNDCLQNQTRECSSADAQQGNPQLDEVHGLDPFRQQQRAYHGSAIPGGRAGMGKRR